MYTNRFEVYIENDFFIVVDEHTKKQVSKNYRYSRYANNLQSKLEIEYTKNNNNL